MLNQTRSRIFKSLCRASSPFGVTGPGSRQPLTYAVGDATNIQWFEGAVPRVDKEKKLGQRGCVLWFTGLSGSGKSIVAATLEHALLKAGHTTALLDGDNVRHGLNSNLGFTAEDRAENIRRIGEVSRLFVQAGIITLAAFISPYRSDRQRVRQRLNCGDFVEVFMDVPLEVCEKRDTKGLYRKARSGQMCGFTGVDDPYEPPCAPEIILRHTCADGTQPNASQMAAHLLDYLRSHRYLQAPADDSEPDEPTDFDSHHSQPG